jgi:hypothetical protein
MNHANQAVKRLTDLYIQAQYSTKQMDEDEKEQTILIWQGLRRNLLLANGLFWIRKLFRSDM